MTWITLPYPISANRYWRAVTIKGHAMMVPTSEAKAYKRAVGLVVNTHGVRCEPGRMVFHVKLFPARPQDWAKRARKDPDTWDDTVQCLDLDNCQKVLIDALNGIAWKDDKQLREIHLVRCEPDEQGSRVEILIERLVKPAIAPELFAEAT